MRFIKIYSLFLVFITVPAVAGSGSGNGVDVYPEGHGHMWFQGGARAVRYCVERGTGFGVTEVEFHKNLRGALKTWKEYIRAKLPRSLVEYESALKYTQTVCDGSEDVKFYLGVSSPEVEKVKKKMIRPLALAHMTDFNKKTLRGRGFVWLASEGQLKPGFPNWSRKGALRAVLLHELGHILGVAHEPGTVMAPNLDFWIEQVAGKHGNLLSTIDYQRALIPNLRHALNLQGEDFFLEAGFRLMFGRSPRGRVTSHVSRRPCAPAQPPLANPFAECPFQLTVGDTISTETFDVTPGFNLATSVGNQHFLMLVADAAGGLPLFDYKHNRGSLSLGELKLSNGNTVPVHISRNLDISVTLPKGGTLFLSSMLSLYAVTPNGKTLLFSARPFPKL